MRAWDPRRLFQVHPSHDEEAINRLRRATQLDPRQPGGLLSQGKTRSLGAALKKALRFRRGPPNWTRLTSTSAFGSAAHSWPPTGFRTLMHGLARRWVSIPST